MAQFAPERWLNPYRTGGSFRAGKFNVFFRMCDETLAAIRNNDALMVTAASRYEIDPDHMHPDNEKHILLFDLIYCCSTYNLFKGIPYVVPKSSERQLIQTRKEKAIELKQEQVKAQEKLSQLNEVLNILSEKVTVGKIVSHKSFGSGTITSINDGSVTIDFNSSGIKELGINLSIANGFVFVDGLELSKEQIILLKEDSKIRNAETYAEKALAPYLEYLE